MSHHHQLSADDMIHNGKKQFKIKVKSRVTYFTTTELEIITAVYAEYEHVLKKKSNTAAAA